MSSQIQFLNELQETNSKMNSKRLFFNEVLEPDMIDVIDLSYGFI